MFFCGKIFVVPICKKRYGRKFCSRKCHLKNLGRNRSGPNHWNWQGGISDRWSVLHNSIQYQQWRISVYQRDMFKCKKCGQKQSRTNPLHAHHIKAKKDYPELILEIDNGLTLCKRCHIKLHRSRH